MFEKFQHQIKFQFISTPRPNTRARKGEIGRLKKHILWNHKKKKMFFKAKSNASSCTMVDHDVEKVIKTRTFPRYIIFIEQKYFHNKSVFYSSYLFFRYIKMFALCLMRTIKIKEKFRIKKEPGRDGKFYICIYILRFMKFSPSHIAWTKKYIYFHDGGFTIKQLYHDDNHRE